MQLITVRETADRCSISPRMVQKLIKQAELPIVRVGRCVRLREDDVEAFIRRVYSGRSTNKQLVEQEAAPSPMGEEGRP